jgi:sugar phosphate isomerase/epimerase
MKNAFCFASLALVACMTLTARAEFPGHLGLQLYSLRATALAKGVPASLDQAKAWGFVYLEGALYTDNMAPAQVRAAVESRGMKLVSVHVQFPDLEKDIPKAVRTAQELGVSYVICPWIPHDGPFDRALMEKAADVFNRAGAAFRAAGIIFGYHPHGYEFVPGAAAGDTLLDDLIRATKAGDVSYEMDVFWITHGGGDPVKLLNKYAGRWVALHLKDIRKGAPTGFATGHALATDNVTVGTGAIDWKAVIGAAEKVGVNYYFIEDETPAPLECVPASLAYLKALKL